jgi:hypothetical protein
MAATKHLLLLLAILPVCTAGCGAIEEHKDECIAECYDCWDAWCAWHRAKHCYANEPNLHAFGAGFRAGYIHIMNGGNGCPPMLAPRKYWGTHCCFRGDGCESPSLAWFNGFSQGVVQGLYEGVAGRNQIVTSRDLYGCECEETIDINAMLEAAKHNHTMAEPHLHPGETPDQLEWTPQPLPQGAYDQLQDANEIWDQEFFQPGTVEGSEAPLLEPVEQLPTETTENAVSPALIEFLDPFESAS